MPFDRANLPHSLKIIGNRFIITTKDPGTESERYKAHCTLKGHDDRLRNQNANNLHIKKLKFMDTVSIDHSFVRKISCQLLFTSHCSRPAVFYAVSQLCQVLAGKIALKYVKYLTDLVRCLTNTIYLKFRNPKFDLKGLKRYALLEIGYNINSHNTIQLGIIILLTIQIHIFFFFISTLVFI